ARRRAAPPEGLGIQDLAPRRLCPRTARTVGCGHRRRRDACGYLRSQVHACMRPRPLAQSRADARQNEAQPVVARPWSAAAFTCADGSGGTTPRQGSERALARADVGVTVTR